MVGRRTAISLGIALLVVVAAVVWAQTSRANYWDRLATCETGGRWDQRGSTYVGGLGIYWANWQRWARAVGVNKPAYLASREEQIRVATYGRRIDGAYWGCMRVVGMPW